MSIDEILRLLSRYNCPLFAGTEEELQASLSLIFDQHGIDYQREVQLNDSDRIDFCVGGIGIECKSKGNNILDSLHPSR